jgi:hypothetical protein
LSKRTTSSNRSRIAVLAMALFAFGLLSVSVAFAGTGAVGPGGTSTGSDTTTTSGPIADATLADDPNGKCDKIAVAPAGAPQQIIDAIDAGNRICDKPYVWGGGHGDWEDNGYDCSGTVSYLLHAAGLLKTPMDSGSLARLISKKNKKGKKKWKKGLGAWITIAANGGHTYMDIAGLRMDTSGGPGGPSHNGPRWATEPLLYNQSSYKILHPKKF